MRDQLPLGNSVAAPGVILSRAAAARQSHLEQMGSFAGPRNHGFNTTAYEKS